MLIAYSNQKLMKEYACGLEMDLGFQQYGFDFEIFYHNFFELLDLNSIICTYLVDF